MKRWHEDYPITHREWKKHHTSIGSNDPSEKGRFRKMRAFDCGIPHCKVCHYNKYPKRELHEHETLSDLSFKEQLKELDNE